MERFVLFHECKGIYSFISELHTQAFFRFVVESWMF